MKNNITPAFVGHKKGKGTRSFCNYTVYDNKTDLPVIVAGTARECARAMGIQLHSFYAAVVNARKGTVKKWTIYREFYDGKPQRKRRPTNE